MFFWICFISIIESIACGSEALLSIYQGATIVDQIVSISPVENYVANRETQVTVPNTNCF